MVRAQRVAPFLVASLLWWAVSGSAAGLQSASNAVLRASVDPRVELFSLIFRLAGNPEYNKARIRSYESDAEKQFGKFRQHAVVKLARQLRADHGVSYDACMGLAVHVNNAYDLQAIVPLEPWPDSLDRRWTVSDVTNFLALARRFVVDASFRHFIEAHRDLYHTAENRMQTLMDKQAHLDWFESFFGPRSNSSFTLVLGMLNGPCSYGPHARDAAGNEQLFSILGVWQTDAQGSPAFSTNVIGTIIHEFSHSYANPVIDRHLGELGSAGQRLFVRVADLMRSQAYGNADTMLRESLVRASVIRYQVRYQGSNALARAVQNEKSRGFLWMGELCALLGEYETRRQDYPTLETFSPRLVEFFNAFSQGSSSPNRAR